MSRERRTDVKRRLAAIVLLLAQLTQITPAFALPVGDAPAYQPTRMTSRFKRIAVIRPSRHDVLNQGNLASLRRNEAIMLGNIWGACRNRGLEVHFYDTAYFEQTGNAGVARDLWENMGSQYAVSIILYPTTSIASFQRYVCADSTNTQIIVVGGASGNNALGWASGDTTIRGFVDALPSGVETPTSNYGAFLTTSNLDTLWGTRWATGKRLIALPSGMARVVRVLKPGITSHLTSFIQSADSANINPVGTITDSVAAAADYLGPLWRTEFTNNLAETITAIGAVAAGNEYTNTLTSAQCPHSVYFLKFNSLDGSGSAQSREYPQLLWALICRFTTAAPLRWAFDIDDATDMFVDNVTGPNRWTNEQATAFMDSVRKYIGTVPTPQMNPSNAAAYLTGTNPRYEMAWSGTPHNYLRGKAWIHHAHDSTTGYIGSNLNGGFGGYASGNGSNITQGGVAVQKFGHRYASRWNPGANEGGFIGAGGNFGIVQRLFWSDSVRRAVCPDCFVPPYLSFPANQVLPVGYRARATTTNPLWTENFSAGAECPPESLFWAYHYGLKRPSDDPYIFLRIAVDNPRGYVAGGGTNGQLGSFWQFDRDSVVAASPFLYSNEKYSIVGAGGRKVTAISVGSFLNGSSGVGGSSGYKTLANDRTAKVLGLRNAVFKSEQNNPLFEPTFNSDVNGVYGGAEGWSNFSYEQSSRVLYDHPLNSSVAGYELMCSVLGVLQQMKAMDTIAGRRTQLCVPGWRVYERE